MVHAERLDGVNEIRPGVYMFYDLAQESIGACERQSIAVSVLCTVIGHNRRANRIVIDGGALALSKDLSACEAWPEVGYGLVADAAAAPIVGLYVESVHQEHGLICARDRALPWRELPVGSRVRVLPNHACMTVAPYDRYYVVDGGTAVEEVWHKISGWHADAPPLPPYAHHH
jgi:D-serine deaminase-like pyridoxal phosphate-dependent protein